MLQTAPIGSVFGVITDFLASDPTPEAIIAYRLPQDLEARAHDLLTAEEQQEMFDFMRVDQMMSLLKAKTRLKLKQSPE